MDRMHALLVNIVRFYYYMIMYNDIHSSSSGLSPKLLFSVAIRDWNRKKPGWVNELIRSLNMRSVSNKHTVGMEMNFALYANYFKKPVSGIDSFEDHCDMVNGMTDEQVGTI